MRRLRGSCGAEPDGRGGVEQSTAAARPCLSRGGASDAAGKSDQNPKSVMIAQRSAGG